MLNSINLTNHAAEKTFSNFNSYREQKNKNEEQHDEKTDLSIWSLSLFLSVARIEDMSQLTAKWINVYLDHPIIKNIYKIYTNSS
jgi:hypothetical protein